MNDESPQAEIDNQLTVLLSSRAVPVMSSLIALNVFLYVLMAAVSGNRFLARLINPADPLTLLAFGAKSNLFIAQGEYFRLITATFVHIGLAHLVLNLVALWIIGAMIERLYGSPRFLLMYLLAGAGGWLASWLAHRQPQMQWIPGAGASGALFGIAGVLMIYGWRHRQQLPRSYRWLLTSGVLLFLTADLLLGFFSRHSDNAAHLGGLLTGLLLTLLIPATTATERWIKADWIILILCVAMLFASFTRAWLRGRTLLPRRHSATPGSVQGAVATWYFPVLLTNDVTRSLPLPVLYQQEDQWLFKKSVYSAQG